MSHTPDRAGVRWRLLAAAAALAVVTAACGGGSESDDLGSQDGGTTDTVPETNQLEDDDEPQDGGQLKMALNAETDGWNPGTNQIADSGNIVASTVFESLMAFDADGAAVPYLATEVTSNEDFTEWTITIPDGVTFHDGSSLTSQVVADNLNFYAHGPTLSKVAMDELVGIPEVTGPTTVVVPMNASWSGFPATLAGPSGYIMGPSMLLEENGYGVDDPVGTGPFRFESWVPDQTFSVSAFDDYRIEGEPHLDEIEFSVILDPGSREAALESGDVQMMLTTSPGSLKRFSELDGYTVISDLNSEKSFVQLNTSAAPFDNITAREALARATDRESIREVIGEGVVELSDDPFVGPWKSADPGYVTFDLEQAKTLVARYEAEMGEPLSFKLSGLNNVAELTLMNLLAEQWTAAGMVVEVEQVEQTVFISQAVGGTYEAQSFRGFAYADPDSDYVFFHSSTATPPISINFTQLKDQEIDSALDAARTVVDPVERKPYYERVAKQLNSQFNHIWLYNTPYTIIADERVRGLNGARTVPFGNFLPKTWWGEVWLED